MRKGSREMDLGENRSEDGDAVVDGGGRGSVDGIEDEDEFGEFMAMTDEEDGDGEEAESGSRGYRDVVPETPVK
jgi:hypothetical protein